MNDWKGITGQFGGESMVNRLRDALVTNPVRMIDLLRNWDKDNSASISPTEFCKALRSYGCPAAESDIRELFDKWDTNGDGELSLLEIHKILRHGGNVRLQRVLKNQPITQKEIRDAQLPPLRKHVPKPVEVLHPSQRPKTVPIVDSDEADRAHKKFQDQAAALHRARLNFASHALQVKPETASELLDVAEKTIENEARVAGGEYDDGYDDEEEAELPPATAAAARDDEGIFNEGHDGFTDVQSRSSRAAAQFIEVLSAYAKNTGGTINHQQFSQALQELGVDFENWEDSEKLFCSLDTDGSGKIDMSELKAAVGFIVDPEQDSALEKLMMMDDNKLGNSIQKLRTTLATQAARVIDLFQTWDANGDGMVTKDEFRQVLHTLPSLAGSSPSAIDSLFASFDADGSGAITFTELNRMMRNAPGAEAGDASFKKRRRGPVVVCDVPVLKEEVAMNLLQMAMREEMRQQTSAKLQQELDDIDAEAQEFREKTRRQGSKTFQRQMEEKKQAQAEPKNTKRTSFKPGKDVSSY